MKIHIPYGLSSLTADIPDEFQLDVIEPPFIAGVNDPLREVQAALNTLSGNVDIEAFSGARSVGIAVNDKTRPVPHEYLLPPLMERLERVGIPDEAITFYIAVGTHPPLAPSDFAAILPSEIISRYKVLSHDSDDEDQLEFLGETARGTPVWSNRGYCQAEFKIAVGNIEAHQFAGFSGGVKSAAIGLAGLKTIAQNHILMADPNAQMGEYIHNPVRQDIEEIGRFMGVDLALNAVLNQQKKIVQVLAGTPLSVMEAGVPLSRQVGRVAVSQKYDLVISSPGGYPKDINVYQAQKALSSAVKITQSGGTVIIAAACPEGSGSTHYEEWMEGKGSYEEVRQQFEAEGFQIGPHKAFQYARDAGQVRLMFCSEMDDNLASKLLLNPVKDLQTAIDKALGDLSPDSRVAVLPQAASMNPFLD